MKSRYLLMIAAGAAAFVYAQDKVTPPIHWTGSAGSGGFKKKPRS